MHWPSSVQCSLRKKSLFSAFSEGCTPWWRAGLRQPGSADGSDLYEPAADNLKTAEWPRHAKRRLRSRDLSLPRGRLQWQHGSDERKLKVHSRALGSEAVGEPEGDCRNVFLRLRCRACRPAFPRQHLLQLCNRNAELDQRTLVGLRCSACVRRRLGCILVGLRGWPERCDNASEPYASVRSGLGHVVTTVPLVPRGLVTPAGLVSSPNRLMSQAHVE